MDTEGYFLGPSNRHFFPTKIPRLEEIIDDECSADPTILTKFDGHESCGFTVKGNQEYLLLEFRRANARLILIEPYKPCKYFI